MKILHCLNHFLPHHIAGTEVYTMALMKSLHGLGIDSCVVIPNYGKEINERYETEGFTVIKYAEPSVIDRSLQMGWRKPDGLKNFEQLIIQAAPDIIHFHELAGSNGIGLEHVKLAKAKGFKTVMTFHLAGYTCKTGTLMYKEQIPCDGMIREKQCTACWFQHKEITGWKAGLLNKGASLMYALRVDISKIPFSLATALSFPSIIKKLRVDFETLVLHCDALVAISKWYLEVLKKNTSQHDKISLIQQALPGNIYQEIISSPPRTGMLKLVFIGRISNVKGITHLLTAIRSLPKHQLTLDIYGESAEPEYMEECQRISATMNNITWKGRLPVESVIHTLSGYDVLCLPSVVCEMAPLVIQEAFAAGIPVLASDVYGNAEQIKDGHNGWLFKFKNTSDLENKLLRLINEPAMIAKAKSMIGPVNTFATVAGEYAQLYNKLLAAR